MGLCTNEPYATPFLLVQGTVPCTTGTTDNNLTLVFVVFVVVFYLLTTTGTTDNNFEAGDSPLSFEAGLAVLTCQVCQV